MVSSTSCCPTRPNSSNQRRVVLSHCKVIRRWATQQGSFAGFHDKLSRYDSNCYILLHARRCRIAETEKKSYLDWYIYICLENDECPFLWSSAFLSSYVDIGLQWPILFKQFRSPSILPWHKYAKEVTDSLNWTLQQWQPLWFSSQPAVLTPLWTHPAITNSL